MQILKKDFLNRSLILLILIISYFFVCAQSYVSAISSNLFTAVFRLHVIANSDSDEDQVLKLKVRDALLNYMNTICSNCSTKEEAITIAKEHSQDFYNIANSVVKENGYNYPVKININNFYFPTKNYGDISLPAGYYDALRVELGEAKGKNWWCVMFPSLCFIDVSSGVVDDEAKENLKQNLDDESYNIVSNNDDLNIEFKFKLIEFLSEKNFFTAKK